MILLIAKTPGSVSQRVWHDKDPSLLKGNQRRTLQPFAAIETSPYVRNILEPDLKQHLKKKEYNDSEVR